MSYIRQHIFKVGPKIITQRWYLVMFGVKLYKNTELCRLFLFTKSMLLKNNALLFFTTSVIHILLL